MQNENGVASNRTLKHYDQITHKFLRQAHLKNVCCDVRRNFAVLLLVVDEVSSLEKRRSLS